MVLKNVEAMERTNLWQWITTPPDTASDMSTKSLFLLSFFSPLTRFSMKRSHCRKTLYKTFVFMCYWPITGFPVSPPYCKSYSDSNTKTNPCNSNCNCRTVQMVQNSTNGPRFPSECVLKCILKLPAWIQRLLAFVWLCSRVSLHVSSQINCLNTCKVTLHAFVRLFSKVNFDMSSQTTCISGCIVIYVAFVRFCSSESRVSF